MRIARMERVRTWLASKDEKLFCILHLFPSLLSHTEGKTQNSDRFTLVAYRRPHTKNYFISDSFSPFLSSLCDCLRWTELRRLLAEETANCGF